MKIRWSLEAIEFIEAIEDYSSGLGLRVLRETEGKLRRFAGLHVIVPVLSAGGAVRRVHRMVLSARLPYKVYYVMRGEVIEIVTIRHARQRPIECQE